MAAADLSRPKHRPPHHLTEGTALFITASTYNRVKHLRSTDRRSCFEALLRQRAAEYDIDLLAWVVLPEHYHLVMVPKKPENAASFLNHLHVDSAREWNAQDAAVGRQVWYQYWDRTLWTEGDLWSRINYVHRNPEKHGLVVDLREWPWSSYALVCEEWCDPLSQEKLARFPAPRKLRGDDF